MTVSRYCWNSFFREEFDIIKRQRLRSPGGGRCKPSSSWNLRIKAPVVLPSSDIETILEIWYFPFGKYRCIASSTLDWPFHQPIVTIFFIIFHPVLRFFSLRLKKAINKKYWRYCIYFLKRYEINLKYSLKTLGALLLALHLSLRKQYTP